MAPPGEGYGQWTGAGTVTERTTGRRIATAWSSPDARGWRRTALPTPGGASALASGAAAGRGVAVVVGTVASPEGDADPAAWTSADGTAWTYVAVPHAAGHQTLSRVAAGPAGFVAVSLDGGATWHRQHAPGLGGLGEQRATGVAITGDTVVVVGVDDTVGAVWLGRLPA